MLDKSQYKLTWDQFKTIHEDIHLAFERLCRSLFLKEFCDEGTVLHSDPNHPGVEVNPVMSARAKGRISFQAKYFKSRPGYPDIRDSAEKITEYYSGALDQVYLFCNKNLKAGCKNFKDVARLLNDAGIKIISVTGDAIFDMLLNHPTLLTHYFGIVAFDNKWVKKNLEVSIDFLGNRHNPRFNIETKPETLLSLFVRNTKCAQYINQKRRCAIETITDLLKEADPEDKRYAQAILSSIRSTEEVGRDSVQEALHWECRIGSNVRDEIKKSIDRLWDVTERNEEVSNKKSLLHERKDRLRRIDILTRMLDACEVLQFNKQEKSLLLNQIVVVTGEMGTGKSQLLSSIAKDLHDEGRFVILLLGQSFTGTESADKQIIGNLLSCPTDYSIETLLDSMQEEAFREHTCSVLIIDALNESLHRSIWEVGLIRIKKLLESRPNVRLVISLREGFEEMCLGKTIVREFESGTISRIPHYGFADDSPEAIQDFLSHYGVPFSPEIYLHKEASNPLFLTWLCKTYDESPGGIHSLIEAVIRTADEEASKQCGSDNGYQFLYELISGLITLRRSNDMGKVSKKDILSLQVWDTYGIISKIAYLAAVENFGVISRNVYNGEEIYRIEYNLLDEYLQARNILQLSDDRAVIRQEAARLLASSDPKDESLFVMLSSLYALKYHEECIDLIDEMDGYDKQRILEWYFVSFTWRDEHISLRHFIEIAHKYHVPYEIVFMTLIENSTKIESGLNALGLHEYLFALELYERDYVWTLFINNLSLEDRIVNLIFYLEKGGAFNDVNEKKVELLLILFSWFLTSSNRTLRDHTSKAMIELLKSRLHICGKLLSMFCDVNDPYVIQRLYGIVLGATLKCVQPDFDIYHELVIQVYSDIFDKEYVFPDILLRDYARLIIEGFISVRPETVNEFDLEKLRPPYNSIAIPKTEPGDFIFEDNRQSGISRILSSMKMDRAVEGVGFYGDFGRYVFQNALEQFADADVDNAYYYALFFIFKELGYKEELFGEYDSSSHNPYITVTRFTGRKVERIGKKYQWIALYNVLARISDHYHLRKWGLSDETIPYTGAWDPFVRDFDPTMNTRHPLKSTKPFFNRIPLKEELLFFGFNANEKEAETWVREDSDVFTCIRDRFIRKDADGKEWICLYTFSDHRIRPDEGKELFPAQYGEQRISLYAGGYLLKNGISSEEMELIRTSEYFDRTHEDIVNCYSLFNREYAWSPGYEALFDNPVWYGEDEKNVRSAVINYLWECEYDASQETATSMLIPDGEIIRALNLQQNNDDGVYYCGGEVVAFDMGLFGDKSELFIRKEYMDDFLHGGKYSLIWRVTGEKQYFFGEREQKWQMRRGVFFYSDGAIDGELQFCD